MKILHFVETYLQITETFIYNFIKASSLDNEIIISYYHLNNLNNFPIESNMELFQLPEDPIFSKRNLLSIPKIIYFKMTGTRPWFSRLKGLIDSFQPDVVHCHFGTIGVDFSEFTEYYKIKIPFITSFYGYDASELPKRNKRYANRLKMLWKNVSFILAEGPELSSKLQKLGASVNKIKISPILVNSKKYQPRIIKENNNSVKFLLIGRFVEKKGFHLFFEALGKLKDKIGNFKIIVIGAGPMESVYLEIIKKHNYLDNVKFKGLMSLNECINYMQLADVLIHPSVTAKNGDSEGGAPTILIEAQIIGLPIISSTHADIPYIMGYQDFLAKEGSIEDLIRVIKLFLNDQNLMKKIILGRAYALKRHDLNSSEIYRNILTGLSN